MKLSIFPKVNPLPKNKEEKQQESKKASICEIETVLNDDDLVKMVSSYAWSPFIFKDNKRKSDNFISCDLLVYDIDEGLTIDEAEKIVEKENLCCLCLPSTSHSPKNPRFRIILPLARTITSQYVYQETWASGADLFGVVDEQAKDMGRFYFACRKDDGFWLEGDFFQPVLREPVKVEGFAPSQTLMIPVSGDLEEFYTKLYGEKREKVPEAVDFFVKNAKSGIPGKWTNSLNAFVFSLTLSGVDDSIIMDVCEQLAPEKLDRKDLYQIKRSIRDGKAAS